MRDLSELRKTKIVCTLGPASSSPEMLEAMIQAGMDVARLNFSHGDHASHGRVIKDLRRICQAANREIGILQDLAGPKIRLGILPAPEMRLETGQRVSLVPGEEMVGGAIPVNYPHFYEDVAEGEQILLADGLVTLVVEEKAEPLVHCRVVAGGVISSHKGVNLPRTNLRIPAFTEKDRKDLEMGLEMGVDFVAMSFVRGPRDLDPVLEMLNQAENRPLLIAKIEKPEAVDSFLDILAVVDGIMVARGDLGVEMRLEEVPLIQKRIIRQARQAGKVTITATQMLRSMIDSPRPTRAEAADVANAILDGTDAVMLSEESAMGAYPLEAVRTLDRIARATEPAVRDKPFLEEGFSSILPATEAALSRAACWLAEDLKPAAIVASTTSGGTARLIARYRSPFPVVGMTPSLLTCRQLNLSWGVIPALIPRYQDTDQMLAMARTWMSSRGLARRGERIIVTAGLPVGVPGTTNLVQVLEID